MQNAYVSEIIPQAMQMTRVMRTRIDRVKVKGEDGHQKDEGEEIGESIDAETANLKLLQQNSEAGPKSVFELQYFKEKKKQSYLNTLLNQLKQMFIKLKNQHGAEKTKRLAQELEEAKSQHV